MGFAVMCVILATGFDSGRFIARLEVAYRR